MNRNKKIADEYLKMPNYGDLEDITSLVIGKGQPFAVTTADEYNKGRYAVVKDVFEATDLMMDVEDKLYLITRPLIADNISTSAAINKTGLDASDADIVFGGVRYFPVRISAKGGDLKTRMQTIATKLSEIGLVSPLCMQDDDEYILLYKLDKYVNPIAVNLATAGIQRFFPWVIDLGPGIVIPLPGICNCKILKQSNKSAFDAAVVDEIIDMTYPRLLPEADWNKNSPALWDVVDFFVEKSETTRTAEDDTYVRIYLDDGNIIIKDKHYGKVAMWGQDCERYIYKATHPRKLKPAPVGCLGKSDKGSKFITPLAELKYEREHGMQPWLPTGLKTLDKLTGGIPPKGVTIVTGMTGCGKSTVVSQIVLNMMSEGFKIGVFSAELAREAFYETLHCQAAGRDYLIDNPANHSIKRIDPRYERLSAEWLEGMLYLRNNECSSKIDDVLADMEELVNEHGIQVVVIDNLMMVDLSDEQGDDEWQRQKSTLVKCQYWAKNTGVAVIFVVHPKKQGQGTPLELYSLLGSSTVPSLVDCIYSVALCDNSFKEWYSRNKDTITANLSDADNAIQILKGRGLESGRPWIPLHYEKGSRRMLSAAGEVKHYGWTDDKVALNKASKLKWYIDEDNKIVVYNPYKNIPDAAKKTMPEVKINMVQKYNDKLERKKQREQELIEQKQKAANVGDKTEQTDTAMELSMVEPVPSEGKWE